MHTKWNRIVVFRSDTPGYCRISLAFWHRVFESCCVDAVLARITQRR